MTDSMQINMSDSMEIPVPKMLLKFEVHKTRKRGWKKLAQGAAPEPDKAESGAGRVPRISKLMALAIHLQNLVDKGAIRDYAEIARLTGLTRARVTQIMNLNLLSPRIQEEILFLPKVLQGHDPITERDLRPIAMEPLWDMQLKKWKPLLQKKSQFNTI